MINVWYVYTLTNFHNTVFYTGITNNLERRVVEHLNKVVKNSFTDKYNVTKLIWFEEFSSPEEAIAVEKRIKGWSRAKKIDLVKENNPCFNDLTLT